MKGGDKYRTYFNKLGEEVMRDVPKEFDEDVVQEYYYYT